MSSVPKPERTTRRLVGLAVAVGVLEVEQLGAVGDVGAAVAGLDAGGDQQAVGEDGGLVGLAVAVGVFEDDDLVVGLLARLDLRIDLADATQSRPCGVEVHLDRLGEQRVGGEEVDLEPVGATMNVLRSISGSGSGILASRWAKAAEGDESEQQDEDDGGASMGCG